MKLEARIPSMQLILYHEVWVDDKLQRSRTYNDDNRLETISMYEDDQTLGVRYLYNEQGWLVQRVNELAENGIIERYEHTEREKIDKASNLLVQKVVFKLIKKKCLLGGVELISSRLEHFSLY